MNETAVISYQERDEKNKGSKAILRKQGYLLGNISRKGKESVAVSIRNDELRKTLKTYGRNAVIKLTASENDEYTVMVKEIQIAPITNELQHIDFQQVSLTEEVKSELTLEFVGVEMLEAKTLLLNRHIDLIPVSGFPQDIPDSVIIDVSKLNAGDSIKVSDLALPKNIKAELESEHTVISISEPKVQAIEETEEAEEVVAE